jgi:hypothetical protein
VAKSKVKLQWNGNNYELKSLTQLQRLLSREFRRSKTPSQLPEDKLLYGAEMALPLLRFFKNGNRNLKAFANSFVPETLCRMLTEEGVSFTSTDTMISVIEALTAVTYYEPIA